MLSKKDIQSFSKIYKLQTGIQLTKEEASTKGEKLIKLIRTLIKETSDQGDKDD